MNDRPVDWRCGILDVLEAAALHSARVDVRLDDTWRRLTVSDVVAAAGEDWLVTMAGERVAVSEITAARPVRDD